MAYLHQADAVDMWSPMLHASLVDVRQACCGVFRIEALPLVCSRWCRIIADASMWPSLHLLWDEDSEYVSCALPWLRRRIPGMRELTLQAR